MDHEVRDHPLARGLARRLRLIRVLAWIGARVRELDVDRPVYFGLGFGQGIAVELVGETDLLRERGLGRNRHTLRRRDPRQETATEAMLRLQDLVTERTVCILRPSADAPPLPILHAPGSGRNVDRL